MSHLEAGEYSPFLMLSLGLDVGENIVRFGERVMG
jgi:hypothetical protein